MRGSKAAINKIDGLGRSYLWHCYTVEACRYLVESGININLLRQTDTFTFGRETASDFLGKWSFDKPEICKYLTSVGGKHHWHLPD